MTQTLPHTKTQTIVYAALLDIILVVIFAISGRRSHEESLTLGGIADTAWPFLAALAFAWLITRAWKFPLRLWPHGVCIWLITLTGGMALRILSGDTAEIPFVIVATLVLALFLLGHRAIAAFVANRKSKDSTAALG